MSSSYSRLAFCLGLVVSRMFRNASHKLAHTPIFTIDLLLPGRNAARSKLLRAQIQYTTSSRTCQFASSSSPSPSPSTLNVNAYASTRDSAVRDASTFDYTTVLNDASALSNPSVSNDLSALGDTSAPGAGWDLEILFRETYPSIVAALEAGNIRAAGEAWSVLERSSLLPFLGPSHHGELCRLTTELIRGATWSPAEAQVIDDITVFVAAGGDPRGLIARMRHLILHGDADATLRLFSRYNTMVQQKGAHLDIQLEEPPPQAEAILIDGDARDTSSESFPPSIACLAIYAFALKDSFSEAMKAILSTTAYLSASFVRVYFAHLRVDPAFRTKAETVRAEAYARRIAIAQLFTRPGSFQRHVSNLSKDMSDKNLQELYEHIVGALRESQPWLTMDPSAVSERTPVLLPDFAWSILLRAFMHCRKLDLAERLWDDMTKLGVQPTMDVWTSLLDGYAELRMADRALVTWKLLRQGSTQPSVMAYRALIYGLFNSGRPAQAMERFEEFSALLKRGFYQNDSSALLILYNTVIYWLLANSGEADAQALLRQMEDSGPKPDVVSYNTFMRYYAKVSKPGAIGTVMRRMEAVGVAADVVTYSTVLTALLPVEKDAASVVRTLMKTFGVQLNIVTYTTIISHFVKEESDAGLEAALELLRMMEAEEDESLHPNAVTYTTILSAIHRRQHWLNRQTQEEYVRHLTDRMKKRDLMHSKVTYNMLIKACLENPNPDGVQHALKYYREMVRNNVPIREDTRFLLLKGLARRGAWDEADTIVEEIENSGRVISTWLGNAIATVRNRDYERRPSRRTFRH